MTRHLDIIGAVFLLAAFPISVPIYIIKADNFYKGMIKWLEHIFFGFHGMFWETIHMDYTKYNDIKIKLIY